MKYRICIVKEKLDYYAKSYTGKNTSVIHEAIPLIHFFIAHHFQL